MERLASTDNLIVRQKKEWGEILTDFETKNRYVVMDGLGNELYVAADKGHIGKTSIIFDEEAAVDHCCTRTLDRGVI